MSDTTDPTEDWVNVTDVREILGVTRSRCYELRMRADFPKPVYVDGITVRYRRGDVEAYAAARKPATSTEAEQ